MTALRDFVEFDPSGRPGSGKPWCVMSAYRSLPYRRRRELHLRAGQVMEQLAAPAVDSVADLLSLHFFEGGDSERAWTYAETPARTPKRRTPTTTRQRCIGERSTPRSARRHRPRRPPRHLDRAGRRPREGRPARRCAGGVPQGDSAHTRRRHAGPDPAQASPRPRAIGCVHRGAARAHIGGADVDGHDGYDAELVRATAATMRAKVHLGQEQPRRALAAARRAADEATRLGSFASSRMPM